MAYTTCPETSTSGHSCFYGGWTWVYADGKHDTARNSGGMAKWALLNSESALKKVIEINLKMCKVTHE